MADDKNGKDYMPLALISLVAIVAIVGVVVLFMGKETVTATQPLYRSSLATVPTTATGVAATTTKSTTATGVATTAASSGNVAGQATDLCGAWAEAYQSMMDQGQSCYGSRSSGFSGCDKYFNYANIYASRFFSNGCEGSPWSPGGDSGDAGPAMMN